jgi:hypothetical protein
MSELPQHGEIADTVSPASAPRPEPHTPTAAAASPKKKFAPAEARTAKRPRGRPPKPEAAGSSDRKSVRPHPAGGPAAGETALAKSGAQFVFSSLTMIAAAASVFAGLDFPEAFEVWKFSDEEMAKITPAFKDFSEKYMPVIGKYAVECNFAGAFLPILAAKTFALIAIVKAKRAAARSLAPEPGDTGHTPIAAAPPAEEKPSNGAATAGDVAVAIASDDDFMLLDPRRSVESVT